jgi:mono/diheme cytochrome c family protein
MTKFRFASMLAFIVMAVPVVAAAQMEEDKMPGKVLFESRCPICHQLPEPSMLKLPQWRRLLATMQLRMQQSSMAPLTEQERQQVLDYLATQARQ